MLLPFIPKKSCYTEFNNIYKKAIKMNLIKDILNNFNKKSFKEKIQDNSFINQAGSKELSFINNLISFTENKLQKEKHVKYTFSVREAASTYRPASPMKIFNFDMDVMLNGNYISNQEESDLLGHWSTKEIPFKSFFMKSEKDIFEKYFKDINNKTITNKNKKEIYAGWLNGFFEKNKDIFKIDTNIINEYCLNIDNQNYKDVKETNTGIPLLTKNSQERVRMCEKLIVEKDFDTINKMIKDIQDFIFYEIIEKGSMLIVEVESLPINKERKSYTLEKCDNELLYMFRLNNGYKENHFVGNFLSPECESILLKNPKDRVFEMNNINVDFDSIIPEIFDDEIITYFRERLNKNLSVRKYCEYEKAAILETIDLEDNNIKLKSGKRKRL